MIRRTLLVAAVAASPGAAQLVEAGGGVTIPAGDLNVSRDAGVAGHASVWFQNAEHWMVGSSLEYARLPFDTFSDESIIASDGFALSILSVFAQARVIAAGTGALLRPSLVIGVGATRHKAALGRIMLSDGLTFTLRPDPEWGFTAAGGLGLYVRIRETVGFQTDARYVVTVLEETKPKRWQFDVALRVRVN